MDEPIERITLRMPQDLHALVTAKLEKSHRSLNGEIVARLWATFTGDAYEMPESIRAAIKARALTSETSFDAELIKTLIAGLERKAPAVLVLEIPESISISKVATAIEEAKARLPRETAVRFETIRKK
ncbi:Arc family DNA-binding protein [Paraburkholderia sp. SIMBA_030]|uniref:Arc family DNA-binding protein n=1 Tax=Paraburkholderia sp. SIMBA_030 TaxID=3085773 RepID=UPI00397DB7EF